jgi:glycerophosphoryl diester phosphodiesterase
VIAHRGASALEPENTLRAFAKAHELGADGIELDIFLTKDGHIVVTHDANTKRLARDNKTVEISKLVDLKKLDFGKGEKIPTLEEVFKTFLGKFSVINVEIKSTGLRNSGIESKLADLIKKYDALNKILVSSFNPVNLFRFKKCLPTANIGFLCCTSQSVFIRNRWVLRWLKPNTLNLDKNLFKRPLANAFFSLDLPKWVWTVNGSEDMAFWLKMGMSAIITNEPDKLMAIKKQLYGG